MRAFAAFACLAVLVGQPLHARDQAAAPAAATPQQATPASPTVTPQIVGVVGGSMVADGEAPWMAEIFKSTPYDRETRIADHFDERRHDGSTAFLDKRKPWDAAHMCGAVLIAADWVLTAKHCVTDVPKQYAARPIAFFMKNRQIRLGSYAIGEGAGKTCPPIEVAMHRGPADIALIRITAASCTTSPYAHKALPARIAATATRGRFTGDTRLAVYGWGMVRQRTADAKPFVVNDLARDDTAVFLDPQSPYLQVGKPLRYIPRKTCLATPGYAGFVAPDMICAGVDNGKIDQCNGDSGGPLMLPKSALSGAVLVGIVEGGDGCGLAHTPGVYVYVPTYRDWIATTIGHGDRRKGRAVMAKADDGGT